jgi:NitT/TauT family transport system substrate-binding protein
MKRYAMAVPWRICGYVAVTWLLTLLPATTRASDDAIRLMVGGIEKQIYLPAALAERLGYFTEQGLTVQLLSESSGVNAEDELLSGSVHGVVGFYDHTIDLQAKGKFVQDVVQFGQSPGEAEIVAAKVAAAVRSPADLRGRALGVTGMGSSTHLLTQYIVVSHGVKTSDVTIIPVGSGVSFANAMRQGRIDAGMTTDPTASLMLRSGEGVMLVDLRTPQATFKALGGVYPGACLYMSTLWISTHRAQVQRLANALVKALRFIDSHSAEQITALLPPELVGSDRALYASALAASKSMFTADGRMPPSGPEAVLRILKTVNRVVQMKPIDLARTYTNEFVLAVR